LLIKYIKSVLWRAAKRLSYTEDARCLKVKKAVTLKLNVDSKGHFEYITTTQLTEKFSSFHIHYLVHKKV